MINVENYKEMTIQFFLSPLVRSAFFTEQSEWERNTEIFYQSPFKTNMP